MPCIRVNILRFVDERQPGFVECAFTMLTASFTPLLIRCQHSHWKTLGAILNTRDRVSFGAKSWGGHRIREDVNSLA
jgi:hypothetical protein